MPRVGRKEFSYTREGKRAAEKARSERKRKAPRRKRPGRFGQEM